LSFNNKISNKLKTYFKDNVKFALKTVNRMFVLTKSDIFHGMNVETENSKLLLSNDSDDYRGNDN
jgi:hypothetical protein